MASKTEGIVDFKPEEGSDSVEEKAVTGVDSESTKESVEEFAETQKEEGKDVKVALDIKPKKEDEVKKESVTKTNEVVGSIFNGIDDTVIVTEYLEIDVTKYVDNAPTGETISDTYSPLEIALKYDTRKKNPIVVRTHNGIAKAFEKLGSRPAKKDFKDAHYYIDAENEILYVYSQFFSDFAIVYSKENTYTISIDTGIGDPIVQVVSEGSKLDLPSDLKKDGYAFDGWFKDLQYSSPWDADNDKVNEDTKIYGKWNKSVTGISVTSAATVDFTKAGDTSQIKVNVSPSDAANTKVSYSSSDARVATVDDNGKVTAVGNGTATITVTTEDGKKTATVMVNVAIPEVNPQGTPDDPKAEDPTTEEQPTTTESPVAEPTKEEKATLAMNAGLKISQTGSKINIKWGKVKEADGYEVYVTYCGMKFGKSVKVLKNNAKTSINITKINGKKINLKKNFKVYVAAYKMVGGKKKKLAKTITGHIVGRKNTAYTNVKMIKLAKSKYSIKAGKTAQINAKTVLVDKKKKQLSNAHATQFRYASSNKNIATVNKNGKIKGISKGTCTIYVYSRNGYAKKASVTVK